MLKYFEGETNKMEVKQVKNLGYEGEKKGTKKTNYPIVSRKSFTEEVAEANCYSKEDKVYTTRNNLCPPERGWTKITLKKTSQPLGFSEFLK